MKIRFNLPRRAVPRVSKDSTVPIGILPEYDRGSAVKSFSPTIFTSRNWDSAAIDAYFTAFSMKYGVKGLQNETRKRLYIALLHENLHAALQNGHRVSKGAFNMVLSLLAFWRTDLASLQVLAMMQTHRVAPNVVSYQYVLEALQRAGNVVGFEEVWRTMEVKRVVPSVQCWAHRIKVSKERSRTIFSKMLHAKVTPNTACYNALIGQMATPDRPYDILDRIRRGGCAPNRQTYREMLKSYSSLGALQHATQTLRIMEAAGHKISSTELTMLLECRLRELDDQASPKEGKQVADEAMCLFQERNVTPNVFTYKVILQMFARFCSQHSTVESLGSWVLQAEGVLAAAVADELEAAQLYRNLSLVYSQAISHAEGLHHSPEDLQLVKEWREKRDELDAAFPVRMSHRKHPVGS